MEHEKSDISELHDVIVDYLQNNPNAADSLEGIMNYWLPQAYQKIDRARVEQVLEQLIDEGQARKVILADGSILFRQVEPRN